LSCARCGRATCEVDAGARYTEKLADAAQCGIDLAAQTDAGDLGDWDLEQNVRRVQARTGTWRRFDAARPNASPAAHDRSISVRQSESTRHRRTDRAHAVRRPNFRRRGARPKQLSTPGWLLLALGLMAFACGTTLLIWSWLERRDDLWKLGLPVAIGGQVGLFVGLVLHLERIWQNGRLAVMKLEAVDEQLRRLKRDSTDWNATQGTASQAFYTHMAADASPEILLADLKGQFDLLSHEVARRR
jgi:hypothetical protein